MDYKHNKEIVPLAKVLRKNMTKEEKHLWYDYLKAYPIRFIRQKVIRINWSEPFTLENAIQSNFSKTQGRYYITRVFGEKETSLYLGIARQNNTIKHRLMFYI